jgi:hypothetical protein
MERAERTRVGRSEGCGRRGAGCKLCAVNAPAPHGCRSPRLGEEEEGYKRVRATAS